MKVPLYLLCCTICKFDLALEKKDLVCKNCKQKYLIKDNILIMLPSLSKDEKFSVKKWDKFYKKQMGSDSYVEFNKRYFDLYHDDIYKQILKSYKINKETIYLEIGCGHFFLGQTLSSKCKIVIGIDYSFNALLIAQKLLQKKGVKNYLLIQADVLSTPFKNNSIDLIYGGGVIEHFKDTLKCLRELNRILSINGVSFNTVPFLNIGSLTYRQLWGNIPYFPVLKQIAESVHIKLLKGKHMTYGYEYSFPPWSLINLHKKAGFRKVRVEKLDIKFVFEFLPLKLRSIAQIICSNFSSFWPMVKVIAKKK